MHIYSTKPIIMKKISVSACFIFMVFQLNAQKEDKTAFDKSVVIKWSPASLAFGKIGLGSEFNFKKKKSITFNIGIPAEKTLTAEIDGADRNLTMKTFSAMLGYRMYLGKKAMRGFYFEPYLKYLENDATTNTNFNIGTTSRPFLITSNYSGFGLGAQLGIQFVIAKRVVLDWYFLGPEANSSKHDLMAQETGSGFPWNSSEAQDAENEIKNFVNDIPLLKDNLDVTVNAASRNVKTNFQGFLPGIRSGISIGVRF